jgi:hypothetical protein
MANGHFVAALVSSHILVITEIFYGCFGCNIVDPYGLRGSLRSMAKGK